MITLHLQASGEQLGRELAQDYEELWYALAAIADELQGDIKNVANDFRSNYEDWELRPIRAFLTTLTDALCVEDGE